MTLRYARSIYQALDSCPLEVALLVGYCADSLTLREDATRFELAQKNTFICGNFVILTAIYYAYTPDCIILCVKDNAIPINDDYLLVRSAGAYYHVSSRDRIVLRANTDHIACVNRDSYVEVINTNKRVYAILDPRMRMDPDTTQWTLCDPAKKIDVVNNVAFPTDAKHVIKLGTHALYTKDACVVDTCLIDLGTDMRPTEHAVDENPRIFGDTVIAKSTAYRIEYDA